MPIPSEATAEKNAMTGKAYLVRLYEANCKLEFATENDLRFRDALANRLTRELGLVVKEVPSPRATTTQSRS